MQVRRANVDYDAVVVLGYLLIQRSAHPPFVQGRDYSYP